MRFIIHSQSIANTTLKKPILSKNGGAEGSNFKLPEFLKADVGILAERLRVLQNSLDFVVSTLANPPALERQLIL